MSSVILLWNKSKYTDKLEQSDVDLSIVTSRVDINRELNYNFDEEEGDSCLIVLLELSWERSLSRFYGFDIVHDLLLEGLSRPILLCSFFDRKSLYELQGIGRKLARMPFPFVRLPVDPDVLMEKAKNAEPFSDMWYAFVRENILVEEPYEICAHEIKGALSKNNNELRSAVNDALADLDALDLRLPEDLSRHRQRAEEALKEERHAEAREALEVFVSLLERHGSRGVAEADVETEGDEVPKSDIMLVEDEKDQLEYYRRGLERHFNVFAAQRAEEALTEIEENPNDREYVAIIADWWLKEEDGKTWQPMQGFELLDEVGRKHGPIYRVALTSLPQGAFASIRNAAPSGIMDEYFPKGSVGSTRGYSFPQIADSIKDGIEPVVELRNQLPTIGIWTNRDEKKTFKEAFLELYQSDEWESEKAKIERASDDLVEEYVEYEEHYVQGEPAPDIRDESNLTPGTRSTRATRERIIQVLKLRLITLALHFRLSLRDESIFQLLTGKAEDTDYSSSAFRNWYSNLGFSRKDGAIVRWIMPYEEDWLRESQGIDLEEIEKEEIEEKERQFAEFVSTKLEEFRDTKVGDQKIRVPSSIDVRTAKDAIDALENLDRQLGRGTLRQKFDNLLEDIEEKESKTGYLEMLFEKGQLDRFDALWS